MDGCGVPTEPTEGLLREPPARPEPAPEPEPVFARFEETDDLPPSRAIEDDLIIVEHEEEPEPAPAFTPPPSPKPAAPKAEWRPIEQDTLTSEPVAFQAAGSLSKLMGEKMAEQFARWDPATKIIGLRFSNVQEPQDYANFAAYNKDARNRHFNLWTYIDARDAAQAIRKALDAKLTGAHVFGIANSNSVMTKTTTTQQHKQQ